MDKRFQRIFQCPSCSGGLELKTGASPFWRCGLCKRVWKIKNGVSVLLKPNAVISKELKGIKALDDESGIDASSKSFQQALVCLPNISCLGETKKERDYFLGVAAGKSIFEKAKGAIGSGKIVLEIGADWCWAAYQIALAGNHVVALDINADHLAKSLRLDGASKSASLEKVQADMGTLPIKNSSVDVVLAIACVHHSANLDEALAEFARVLRAGGKLILLREPARGEAVSEEGFGKREKDHGINENAPTLREWKMAFSRARLNCREEVAKLNFCAGGASLSRILKLFKREILTLPFLGKVFSRHTITDYNFFALKK